MSNATITKAFGHLSVQGMPEFSRRSKGVPPGGVFDTDILQALNLILRQDPSLAGLEWAGSTFEIRFEEERSLAWYGTDAKVKLDGRTVRKWEIVNCQDGQLLEIIVGPNGWRGWLAVSGGFVQGKWGSFLKVGDSVQLGETKMKCSPQKISLNFRRPSGNLRFIGNPDQEFCLSGKEFSVSYQSSRSGITFEESIGNHEIERPSKPVCIGLIQIPPSGRPIILGPDGPTIGGYPSVGVVIEADHWKLAQLRPGDKVLFERVTTEEAGSAHLERLNCLKEIKDHLTWCKTLW